MMFTGDSLIVQPFPILAEASRSVKHGMALLAEFKSRALRQRMLIAQIKVGYTKA
ncbi:hypothetical protein AB3X91_13510 [Paraburkholderia sp. BR14263]|uniref:hypothetical protein n=1 Tax=unclassified Paraburkholderia TaxID=2615204 RepID=UPI0034D01FF1